MVENRPGLTILSHSVLILGVLVVAFPLYVTFVASTLTLEQILAVPMPLLPGDHFLDNYRQVLILRDIEELSTEEAAKMLSMTQTAVKVRLHRARQALSTLLRKEYASTAVTS